MRNRLRVLIWHIHGSYLSYLVEAPHDFYLPVKPGRPEGYGGKGPTFDWPASVHEVPAEEARHLDLDVIVFQTAKNYGQDQEEILSPAQRRLPKIYLEHNTPKEHPTDAHHLIDDPGVLLVHVTHFNRLMWDVGRTPTMVIEHGVKVDPAIRYGGEIEKGIVVVNGLQRRNRIAGYDVYQQLRGAVPLELAGMNSRELGGLGDIPHRELLGVEARYRFFFNPIRYTSLPLALVEAMMVGLPVVALATTEVPTVIADGRSGFVSCDLDYLAGRMRWLLEDREAARRMGEEARAVALERFNIARFAADWDKAFRLVTS